MQQDKQQPRIFKIGTATIAEDETTANLSPEEVHEMLIYS